MDLKLETKFIKDTNNQYSIRNDGVVIIHYKKGNVKGARQYCERIMNVRAYPNKKNPNKAMHPSLVINGRLFPLKTLILKYFPIEKTELNKRQVGYKDNNIFNCSVDNLYYLENKPKSHIISVSKKRNKKHIDNLSRSYISSKLGTTISEMPDEMYQAMKKRILIKRKLKELEDGK
jgi:hypothetical protein